MAVPNSKQIQLAHKLAFIIPVLTSLGPMYAYLALRMVHRKKTLGPITLFILESFEDAMNLLLSDIG